MGTYGRDGTFYNNDNERRRADARYEQQERLIREQKRQNELLEKQMNKERQKELCAGVEDWSWHNIFVFLKSVFYLVNIICFVPIRITDNSFSFINISVIVFGIMVFFDIYKLLSKYKNNNQNSKK